MSRRWLVLVAIFLLLGPFSALAEISSPYVVDEKSQVLFGDSVEIVATSTYKGLENYTTDYVGNYLHITFSYTHHGCCTANYPPVLYVTNVDPTATTSKTIRENARIFALSPQPTHTTGVYLYDIQFDSTGYTGVVTASSTEVTNFHKDITGLTTTDYVALANYYPRQTPINASSMSFTPLLVYEAPVVITATTTPVIVVPGIMSTKLYKDDIVDDLIWPDTVKIVSSINDDFLDVLKMDNYGFSINPDVVIGNIIKNLNNADYFESLFNQFSLNSYDEGIDLFENPYDWRLDIESTALELKEKIDDIKAERGVTKVNLVAHSMGGLLVKKYLNEFGGDSLDKFIDIGTPHLGSPSAYKILMYGDDLGVRKFFGLININSYRIKEISQNMPSIYQLLPSQKYFEDDGYYVWNGSGSNNRLDFSETQAYLKTGGRNEALVDRASIFHQEVDDINPADYGVETYNIVGCGVPTIGRFYILDDDVDHPVYNIQMVDGDGTVPLWSAESMTAGTTYYVSGVQHAVMPSASGVRELVSGILTSTSTFDISPYSNLSTTSGGCGIPDGRLVSFHSPIELHVYDSSGNHAGPNTDGDIENELSGVVYEEIGDNKFAFLPNGANYTVRGVATDSGTFDVRVQELVGGEVVTTTLWTDVALTLSTQVEFSINSATPAQITLDKDNDGVYEYALNHSAQILGILESTGKLELSTSVESVVAETSSKSSTPPPESVADETEEEEKEVGLESVPTLPQNDETGVSSESLDTSEAKQEQVSQEKVSRYDNLAVVYKSVGYRFLIGVLKGWLWIISKL